MTTFSTTKFRHYPAGFLDSSQRSNECCDSPDRCPASRFSTLMSSSRNSQCKPCPRPMRRHAARSSGVAYSRRGYQASGTERLRPSSRSTARVSIEMRTFSTAGRARSIFEVSIPRSQQFILTFGYQRRQFGDFGAVNPLLLCSLMGFSQNFAISPSRSM